MPGLGRPILFDLHTQQPSGEGGVCVSVLREAEVAFRRRNVSFGKARGLHGSAERCVGAAGEIKWALKSPQGTPGTMPLSLSSVSVIWRRPGGLRKGALDAPVKDGGSFGRQGASQQTWPCCPGPFLMNADVTAQTAEAPGSGSSGHKPNVLSGAEGVSGHSPLSQPLPQANGSAVGRLIFGTRAG